MQTYAHSLIVGGTGMLRAASIALARRSRELTSVAHTRRSLQALDAALNDAGCVHHALALDWTDPDAFVANVAVHVRATSAPDLVLAWLHDDRIGPALARALAPVRGRCDFFQVLGSAAAGPSRQTGFAEQDTVDPAGITLHRIILGFQIEDGHSRWLRDDEISAGVLAAIDAGLPIGIVGTVTPWSQHP